MVMYVSLVDGLLIPESVFVNKNTNKRKNLYADPHTVRVAETTININNVSWVVLRCLVKKRKISQENKVI